MFDASGIREMVGKTTRKGGCYRANVGIKGSYVVVRKLVLFLMMRFDVLDLV